MVAARASALRRGPLRIAVLANIDQAQADSAIDAADRWIARSPDPVRSCPPVTGGGFARPGTYAVEVNGAERALAWLAIALAPNDEAARTAAVVLAAALDGADGLLARSLGGLAETWSARVSGPARTAALIVRVSSAQGALDGAVGRVRALFDSLRQGSLTDADRARAIRNLSEADLAARLDPRGRLAALFVGSTPSPEPSHEPSLADLRAFSAATLRDESLVIVAARSPRSAKP